MIEHLDGQTYPQLWVRQNPLTSAQIRPLFVHRSCHERPLRFLTENRALALSNAIRYRGSIGVGCSGSRVVAERTPKKSNDINDLAPDRARSSAGEHHVDIVGVTGSIPVAPTIREVFVRLGLIQLKHCCGTVFARCRHAFRTSDFDRSRPTRPSKTGRKERGFFGVWRAPLPANQAWLHQNRRRRTPNTRRRP